MNWEAIGAVAELVGAIGVIASLAYLASQIRQNTNAMRGTAHESSVSRNTAFTIAVGTSAQVSEVLTRGHRAYESLTNAERAQYAHLMGAMLLGAETTFHQHKRGNLEEEIWERSIQTILYYAVFSGFRTHWKKARAGYTPEFRAIIDAEISKASSALDAPFA